MGLLIGPDTTPDDLRAEIMLLWTEHERAHGNARTKLEDRVDDLIQHLRRMTAQRLPD